MIPGFMAMLLLTVGLVSDLADNHNRRRWARYADAFARCPRA